MLYEKKTKFQFDRPIETYSDLSKKIKHCCFPMNSFRSFMYMFFMVVLAGTCDRAALLDNYMITEKVSGLGILLLFALYTSSVSSCLATLYGIPRVLQSIAAENIIPVMARLSEGVSEAMCRHIFDC